jgi:hypothetical protein
MRALTSIVILATVAIVLTATAAEAKRHAATWTEYQPHLYVQPWDDGWWQPRQVRRHVRKHKTAKRSSHQTITPRSGLITVSTAAGIKITVNPSFAPKITAFIADLVDQGYTPKRIHCHASHGHVRGSRHYSGAACDIDQTGWGKTAPKMYHVAALAKKHGLRDGGSFRDWGHIDDGQQLSRTRYANRNHRHDTRVAIRPRQMPVTYAAVWNRP